MVFFSAWNSTKSQQDDLSSPKKLLLNNFKWTVTKIVLSEFYGAINIGETAPFCLAKTPINVLRNSQAGAQKAFSSKDHLCYVVTKAHGGTKHLQKKHYSQSTFLDLNSNEYKSILYKINSKSLHWYLEILLFSCCENVCSASSSLFDLAAVWSTACKIKHVPFPQAEVGKLKVQKAADHRKLAVQENYFSSYSSHRIFIDKAKENLYLWNKKVKRKNFS